MKKVLYLTFFLILFLGILPQTTWAEYTNQVGKFNYYDNAVKLKNNLEKKGYSVFLYGGPPYYVTVGQYAAFYDAVEARKKLIKDNISSYVRNIKVYSTKYVISKPQSAVKKPISELKALNTYPLLKDNHFVGAFNNQTFFFYLNDNWNAAANNYLDLTFSHSQVAQNYRSTLTVLLNENPIFSIDLNNTNRTNRNIRVNLPAYLINPGYNNVSLKIYKRMTDKPCEDLFNPANWFSLSRNTFFHLEYLEKKDDFDLSQYPYPYFKTGRENPVDSLLVLPATFSKDHLTAAANLALSFGKNEPFKNVNIKLQKGYPENENILRDNNLIFIGNDLDFPALSQSLKNDYLDGPFIEEFVSPWNPNKKVLRLCAAGDELSFLSKTLFYEKLTKQMKRKQQILKKEGVVFPDFDTNGETITLEQLGYKDIVLKGVYQQYATFNYQLPEGWKLKKGASINLNYRFSEALEFGNSTLTVFVNKIPIGSNTLLLENARGDKVSFEIPAELWDEKALSIEIAFYFDLRNIDCTKRYEEQAWAVINKESSLNLPHQKVTGYLNDYPSSFYNNGVLDNLSVVLPDQPGIEVINTALNLFAFLGHQTNSIGDVELLLCKDVQEKHKKQNMIFLGLPSSHHFIAQINSDLWVKYNFEEGHFEPNDSFYFLEEMSKEAGIVQYINSPWNKEKNILIGTAENSAHLKNTELLLTALDIFPQMKGVVSFLDDYGQVFTFTRPENKKIELNEEKNTVSIKDKIINFLDKRTIVILVILITLIISILTAGLIIYKKNK